MVQGSDKQTKKKKEDEPQIIYEDVGLTIRRNPKNKFCVVRWHFTNDPAKRDPAWREEARRTMGNDAKFRREYDIDYTALAGEKVFPQFFDHQDSIILKPPYPEVNEHQMCWGSMDWGIRNPTALYVHTISRNEDGDPCIDTIWEYQEPAESVQHIADVWKNCPYYDNLQWIAADPHMWDTRGGNASGDGFTSIALQFRDHGIKKLRKAPNREGAWLAIMKEYWDKLDVKAPLYRIRQECFHLRNEFSTAVFDSFVGKTQDSKNLKESIVDKNNHGLDAVKYFMLLFGNRLIQKKIPNAKELHEEGARQRRKVEPWRRHIS